MLIRSCLLILVLPCALRAQDMPLSQILIPGEGWRKAEGPFAPVSAFANVAGDARQIIVWGADYKPQVVLDGEGRVVKRELGKLTLRRDRTVAGDFLYELSSDRRSLNVMFSANPSEKAAEVKMPFALKEPSVLAVRPDKKTLLIADAATKYVWWFRIDTDGSLSAGEKYSTLRLRKGQERSEARALRSDTAGRLYVAMKDGVQVFDPTGRLCGLIPAPVRAPVTAMTFGGDRGDTLFIACGCDVFLRKLSATWAYFKEPEKK
jgi:gluconolactonase